MKKARIMLIAIAILATVGGGLAFKVKKVGDDKYCYLITNLQPPVGGCTSTAENKVIASPVGGGYYTTTTDLNKCNAIACPNVGIPNAD